MVVTHRLGSSSSSTSNMSSTSIASSKEQKKKISSPCTKRKHHRVIQSSRYIDYLLTSVYFVQLASIFAYLMYELDMMYAFLGFIVFFAMVIELSKWSFRVFGGAFSYYCLQHLNDPLKKPTTMKKWCDQGWQMVIHVSMAICEFYLLKKHGWWENEASVWHPEECLTLNPSYYTKLFYIAQLSIWVYTAFSCKFIEEKRKDYSVMMSHHVITIALVGFSYFIGYIPIGVITLFLHDFSDIPLDILKMVNYLKLEGFKGLFLTEISFVVLLVDWYYFRVYLYPQKILYYSFWQARLTCLPDPSINSVSDLLMDNAPFWFMMNILLFILWLLHMWWGYLIARLVFGVAKKGTHQAGRDEYEGTSSDSDKDE